MARLPIEVARERVREIKSKPRRYGPALEPCVCEHGRHTHGGASTLGRCSTEGCSCRRYRRDVVDALVERVLLADDSGLADDLALGERANDAYRRNRKHEGDVRVSASDASSCPRQVQYRERPPDDFYRSWEDKRAARIGSAIHDYVMRVRKALYPWRLFEQPVHVDGLGESKYDSYDPIMARLDDTKTAGDWKWDVVTEDGPPESEWEQAHVYALSLVNDGYPVDEVTITYVQRAQGKDVVFRRPFDRAFAEAAVARLVRMATEIDLGIEQPRAYDGPATSPICARYCFARDYCWNVPQAERHGRSPESWTLLGADPEEKVVAEVLRAYVEGRDAESAGKEAKKVARAKVDGIPHGEYDGMRYGVTPTSRRDEKAYIARLVEWGMKPADERGPWTAIEVPRVTSESVKIGPIPKAEREKREREAAKHAQAVAEAEVEAMMRGEQ